MVSTQVPDRRAIVVGIVFALVGGLIVSIGIVQAAGEGPGHGSSTAVAAPVGLDRRISAANPAQRPVQTADATSNVNRTRALLNTREPVDWARAEPAAVIDRLVLVGDSLAEAAAPVIEYLTPGKQFVKRFLGGTAPCDWIHHDLEATPTTVVVITFTGNNLTPCMLDDAGARLVDQPLVEQYRIDIGVLIEHATAAGAWVVLVGQPVRHPRFDADLEVEGINAVYRGYAAGRAHVSYVDAGQFVETADGRYTDRLPCNEFDTDCAPDGTTVVRGDGVHFCPVVDVVPCPVWSSGAVRFGLAIASAAAEPARFD